MAVALQIRKESFKWSIDQLAILVSALDLGILFLCGWAHKDLNFGIDALSDVL